MDKYETLRNQVVWAVTHYGIVNTEGIIERLRKTVLELDSGQLQNTSSNRDYAKCKIEAEIKRLEDNPEGDYVTRISALEWALRIIEGRCWKCFS